MCSLNSRHFACVCSFYSYDKHTHAHTHNTVSVNGEIYVVNGRQGGERKLAKTMFLPKLRVRKKWYVGLDEMMEEENEHTHEQKQQKQQKQKELLLKEQEGDNDPSEVQSHADAMAAKGVRDEEGEEGSQKQESRRAQQTPADDDGDALPGPQLYDGLTDEARESLSLFFEDAEHPLFHSDEDPTSYERTKNHVWVDAHVLATPVVRDVDGDGFPDLIASVSYFFDEDDYMSSPHVCGRPCISSRSLLSALVSSPIADLFLAHSLSSFSTTSTSMWTSGTISRAAWLPSPCATTR